MSKMVLITGCEQSGTTILAHVIGTHPDIKLGNEDGPLYFISWLLDGINNRGKDENKRWFNPVFNWKCSDEDSLRFRKILIDKWEDICKEYFGNDCKYFGDKWTDFSRAHFDFYEERFKPIWILIHRNKKDTLASMKNKSEWNKDVSTEALEGRYDKCVKRVLDQKDNPRAFIVTYEELCDNPKVTMSKVAEFLKLENKFDTSWVNTKQVS